MSVFKVKLHGLLFFFPSIQFFTSFPFTSTGSGPRSGPLLAMFPGQMYGASQLAKDEAREVKDDGASGKHLHSSPLPETHLLTLTNPLSRLVSHLIANVVGMLVSVEIELL